jgi:hypothetical protein
MLANIAYQIETVTNEREDMKQATIQCLHLKSAMTALLIAGACLLTLNTASAAETTVFTQRVGESETDVRYHYDNAVLKLALEKTKEKYGPYRLQASPPMTFPRAIFAASKNEYANFFIKLSYEEILVTQKSMVFAKFPVDLGIVGYRICFTHSETKAKLAEIKSLEDLKKFSMGQGTGWADVEILRYNNFNVITAANYESLFKMTAAKRFDLFCRGTNELLEEYEAHRDIPGLSYDESFSLAYPLPRFFFTHKDNDKAAKRIEEGLLIAYRDGSLQQLWKTNYEKSINFVQLEKRRIFWIENPLLKNLDFNYRQYFYAPLAAPTASKNKVKP